MKQQDVIDWKVAQLSEHQNVPMSTEMAEFIAQNPMVEKELAFIESFWKHEPENLPQPSSQMRQDFYSMLDEAKAQIQPNDAKTEGKPRLKLVDILSGWLAPNPVAQFASLAIVFVLGMSISRFDVDSAATQPGLAKLEQEVSSLSSLVAISMLQKPSASERLTGVAFSSQTDLSDPNLSATLIGLLENDKSTAVRLAIINTLREASSLADKEQSLIELAVNESNPLVQMELCRLLLINGTSKTQRTLLEQLKSMTLHDDVADFIREIQSTSRA